MYRGDLALDGSQSRGSATGFILGVHPRGSATGFIRGVQFLGLHAHQDRL